ncbi:MAG TPA: hypothetical protein VLG68_08485 [Gammaproteobacteria bacterium]|nr:hypothetical protein [Gammaproteobacteria bacterium]
MHTVSKASLGLLAALCLLAAATAQADVRINTHDKGRIDIEGVDIVITADDGSRAEIDPAGDLKIRGMDVPVTDAERQLLMQYAQNLRDMEKRGQAADWKAWRMAPGILATALGDLFTGANGKQIDHDANEAAQPLKEEFLKLCDDVKAERSVQDQISEALPAFKPYAVIHEHDTENDCHADDKA